jgi:two-component system response regulator (stage 0 sporulation protein A)
MKESPRRTVLALSDKSAAPALIETVQAAGLSVEGMGWDGPDAVRVVAQTMPDILLMDLVLSRWDALEAMRRIGLLPLFTMPFAIMLSPTDMGGFERQAFQRGACGMLRKPLSAATLATLIEELVVENRLPRTDLTEDRVLARLWSLGFSAKLPGTMYLAAATMLMALDAKLMRSLTGRLYPMVAERFRVSSLNVEHAMRRAIESAWSGSAMEQQHALFGNTIDARRGKPTAGEMIGRLAELARVKEL